MLEGYKTYIGIAITLATTLEGIFHWNLGDLSQLQIQLVALVGAAIAIYGRFVAKPAK